MFEEDLKYSYAYTMNPKVWKARNTETVQRWM